MARRNRRKQKQQEQLEEAQVSLDQEETQIVAPDNEEEQCGTTEPKVEEKEAKVEAIVESDDDDDSYNDNRIEIVNVNDLRRGAYVMMEGKFACKIAEINRSKQGKHGSAKVSVVGFDIFSGRRYEELWPTSKNVEVPEVMKKDLEFTGQSKPGYIDVKVLRNGQPHAPVKIPEDEAGELIQAFLAKRVPFIVQYQSAMGENKIVMAREKKR